MEQQTMDSEIAEGLRTGSIIRNSVGDVVFAAMLDAVHQGRLEQGEKINDIEIAKQLGISRTPVREAIQRLKEIGIIESAPNRYTRVVTVSASDFRDALKVFEALFGVVAAEVMESIKSPAIRTMRRTNERFAAAAKRSDARAASEATFQIFSQITALSSNDYLKRGIEAVIHVIWLGGVSLPDWMDASSLYDAQKRLIDGLEANDFGRVSLAFRDAVDVGMRAPSD